MQYKMNKYILGTAALLTMAACSSEELAEKAGQHPVGEQDIQAVQSIMAGRYDQLGTENMDGGSQTRAGLDSEMNATWSIGDELTITNGTLMYNYDVTATANGGKEAVFKVSDGHVAHTSTGEEAFYALYPRRAVTEADGAGRWNGAVVYGQIFAQQSYLENMGLVEGGNKFGGYYVATRQADVNKEGGDTRLTFSFSPMASVIDVDLSQTVLEDGDAVAAVYLRDRSSKTIAAHFSYDCAKHVLSTTASGACDYNYSSRSDVVEVSLCESVDGSGNATYTSLREDKTVRFYILPVQLTQGVEITVRTQKGKFYTKKAGVSVGEAFSGSESFVMTSADGNMATLAKPYYKRYSFGTLDKARQGAWMACVPQNIHLHMLSIPGSHDAATSSVTLLPSSSKTQNVTIAEQLSLGVRAFDLRPSASSDLEIKHGSAGTGVTLAQAVEAMHTYLTSNPSECIFATLHLELPTSGSVSDTEKANWSDNVHNIVKGAVDGGYALEALTSATRFTACRGKIVFIYRDDLTGSNTTYNAAKVAWNDNIARTVLLRGTNGNEQTDFLVSYQDIYSNASEETSSAGLSGYFQQKGGVTDSNAKIEMVKRYIDDAHGSTDRRLFLNFSSYAGGTASNVSDLAGAIMPSVNQYLAGKSERVGIIFSDFVDATYGGYNFTSLMVAHNFKRVFTKRSRIDILRSYDSAGTGVEVAGDEPADGSQVFVKTEVNF